MADLRGTAGAFEGGTMSEQESVGAATTGQEAFRALVEGPALVERSYRGLFEITGADRVAWLHNLTTNEVRSVSPGQGHYAFALNAQGRIQFDLNLLVREGAIWLDLDRGFADFARSHFEKYIITEDVTVRDRTPEFVRLGLVGDGAGTMLDDLGVSTGAVMPWLGVAEWVFHGITIPVLRHDFCGPFSVELFVPAASVDGVREMLCGVGRVPRAIPVSAEAVDVRRIEAGIPWPFREITDEYLPAETGQFDRAVSYTKGCYLGQEVVERMRTREVVARRLVGLTITGEVIPPTGAELTAEDGKPAGTLTSACYSSTKAGVIGLGYVKTALATAGTSLRASLEGGNADVLVADLPFVAPAAD